MYDRFVSNQILNASLRPQPKNECSVYSVACAINAVFGKHITPEEVSNYADWSKESILRGNKGNSNIIHALNSICKEFNLPGQADIFLKTVELGVENIERAWERLKSEIDNPDSALIYHMAQHYTMIAGYFEEPLNNNFIGKYEFADRRDWLIIAEQSKSIKSWQPIRLMNVK